MRRLLLGARRRSRQVGQGVVSKLAGHDEKHQEQENQVNKWQECILYPLHQRLAGGGGRWNQFGHGVSSVARFQWVWMPLRDSSPRVAVNRLSWASGAVVRLTSEMPALRSSGSNWPTGRVNSCHVTPPPWVIVSKGRGSPITVLRLSVLLPSSR